MNPKHNLSHQVFNLVFNLTGTIMILDVLGEVAYCLSVARHPQIDRQDTIVNYKHNPNATLSHANSVAQPDPFWLQRCPYS